MKKIVPYLIIFVLFLTTSSVFAGKQYTMSDVYGKGGVAYDKKLKKPIDGAISKYYGSGELRAQMTFRNGKPNGTQKRYYKSGKLMGEIYYKDGKAISGYMFEKSGQKIDITAGNIAELNTHP